jgi:hypothetical protein
VGVNPSNATIDRARVLIFPERACTISTHSFHISHHVSEARQDTGLPKRLQDYPSLNRSNRRKITGKVKFANDQKNVGRGLLISGSQVRALLGSHSFLNKTSLSQKPKNSLPQNITTFGGKLCAL